MATNNQSFENYVKQARKNFSASDAQIKAFTDRLDKFLFRYLSQLLGPIEQSPQKQAEAAQILGSLESSLRELGLTDELNKLEIVYGTQIKRIRDLFEATGVRKVFSDIDVQIVKNLIDFDISAVANQVTNYVGDVRSTMMRSVLAGETPDFAAMHDTLGTRLASNLDAEINTLTAGFSRAVTVGKAKELGFDLFVYIGPDDKVTRPFCRHVLEKDPPIYTTAEIQALNGRSDAPEGLDVFAYGGGYNCRHDWRPITEEEARKLGWTP